MRYIRNFCATSIKKSHCLKMEAPKIKQQTQPKQFEILVDFMKAHPDLSKGSLKTPDAKNTSNNLWKNLVFYLNAAVPPLRDIAGWKKVWADYKIHLKAKMRRNKNNISRTGGGPSLFIPLSQLEQQVSELLSIEESINGMSGTLSFGAATSSMSEVNADPTEPNTQNRELPQCSKAACTPHKKQQTPLNTQENELPHCSNVTYPPRKKQQTLLENQVENQTIFHNNSIKVFISPRGMPEKIFSDNAINFVGVHRKLRELKEAFLAQVPELMVFAVEEGFSFGFITPMAPHYGGGEICQASGRSRTR
ncbi:uncharacterized protein LOC126765551 [Bactrocera neohumeralis]|uniref:uncharacterized protein LOC126765551 n=1 Tax=Bactrocera neohumeralis TaxID=98809 RepID=UPI0021655026|nr:uncharacterized protein LOC126765551 [Bactrocera neohumeralis]